MLRTLVKTDSLAVDNRTYAVRYFELRTGRGLRRYSAEIVLGPEDWVILDDDLLVNLETRASRVVQVTVDSRSLSGHA